MDFDYKNYLDYIAPPDAELQRAQAMHYAPIFSSCSHVADIGCGQGFFLDALKELGVQPHGVDVDSKLVEHNLQKGYHCFEGDMFEFFEKENAGSFDGLYASHIIEHLTPDVLLKLISEASVFLPEDGIFAMVFPNPRSIISHLESFWIDPTHIRYYDKLFLEFILTENGFKIVDHPAYRETKKMTLKKRIMQPIQRFVQRQMGMSGILSLWNEPTEECVVGVKAKK